MKGSGQILNYYPNWTFANTVIHEANWTVSENPCLAHLWSGGSPWRLPRSWRRFPPRPSCLASSSSRRRWRRLFCWCWTDDWRRRGWCELASISTRIYLFVGLFSWAFAFLLKVQSFLMLGVLLSCCHDSTGSVDRSTVGLLNNLLLIFLDVIRPWYIMVKHRRRIFGCFAWNIQYLCHRKSMFI